MCEWSILRNLAYEIRHHWKGQKGSNELYLKASLSAMRREDRQQMEVIALIQGRHDGALALVMVRGVSSILF